MKMLVTPVELRPGGAAEKAGLRVGDVIHKIDGRPVSPITDLDQLIGTYDIGAAVDLAVGKGKASQIVPVQQSLTPREARPAIVAR